MYGVEHDKFHDIYNLVKWFRINDYSDEMIDDCISYIFERDINWRGICRAYAEKGNIHDFRGKKLNAYFLIKEFKEKGYPEEALDICFKHIYNGSLDWREIYEGYKNSGIEDTRHLCPVCGKYEFETEGSFDICIVCGWEDDNLQLAMPYYSGGANKMSLNEAREAYKNGLKVL